MSCYDQKSAKNSRKRGVNPCCIIFTNDITLSWFSFVSLTECRDIRWLKPWSYGHPGDCCLEYCSDFSVYSDRLSCCSSSSFCVKHGPDVNRANPDTSLQTAVRLCIVHKMRKKPAFFIFQVLTIQKQFKHTNIKNLNNVY